MGVVVRGVRQWGKGSGSKNVALKHFFTRIKMLNYLYGLFVNFRVRCASRELS